MAFWKLPLVVAAVHVSVCTSSSSPPLAFNAALRGSAASAANIEQAAFAEELEAITGSNMSARRMSELHLTHIKRALASSFGALPKTASGGVSASAARYMIHRLFIQLHGWYVKGLSPGGGSWSPSVPALGMADHVPERFRDLFVQKFGSDDFSLHELALMVAAIESLIHGEAAGRLYASYAAIGKNISESLTKTEADEAIYSCLTSSYDISQIDNTVLKSLHGLIREVQDKVARGKTALDFMTVAKILEGVSEQVGHRVDEEFCQDVENQLNNLQVSAGTGRVKLYDFYTHLLNSSSTGDEGSRQQFQQRPEYLRKLGALDESDPVSPKIIIPNYLLMQGHCRNVSRYYDLCCIDLCEDILDRLERSILSPQASPERILEVLSSNASAYVMEGRKFTDALVKKLDEVAAHHGGMVPLHGRLFSQWLHFAHPNECAYPHVSGATRPLSYSEWFEEMGTQATATEAEMQSIVEEAHTQSQAQAQADQEGESSGQNSSRASACDESEDGLCMWLPEEELVDAENWLRLKGPAGVAEPTNPALQGEGFFTKLLRAVAGLFVLGTSGAIIAGFARQSLATWNEVQGYDPKLSKKDGLVF